MQFYSIRGGDKNSLENNEYNIGVGISLGNKWFSSENIVDLVKWSLRHTKEYVVVYVADSLHAINIEIRDRRSPVSAAKKALVLGNKIIEEVQVKIENQLPLEDRSRIHYAKWEDFHTEDYINKLNYLYKKYKEDIDFRNEIINLIEGFLENENRDFSLDDKIRLGHYIIEELPELISRVPIAGIVFDANAYPGDSDLLMFVESLQKGDVFPEIKKNILSTAPKVSIEVW